MVRGLAALLGLALIATACGGEDASGRTQLGGAEAAVPAELRAHLDSGTLAYRAGDYHLAEEHYGRAVEANPHFAAGWLGIAMALRAAGDEEAADSALAEAHRLAPGLIMDHPAPHAGGMPAGHPAPTDADGPNGAEESPPGIR